MNASKAIRYYNAGHIIAAPIVAITANSPFLFGKSIWEETRIPVFEQTVFVPSKFNRNNRDLDRVTFGSSYLKESILEVYLENLDYYILLPELMDKPPDKLSHLRFHNGTIWRWIRPIIDMNKDGVPHIRIEHRVAPAGPSLTDMIADIAFFLGLIRYYAYCKVAPEKQLAFGKARTNFYQAARYGLNARVDWMESKNVVMKDLLLELLIPQAKQGLLKLGIKKKDAIFYIDEIIKPRVQQQQTGSQWQQKYIAKHGPNFHEMLHRYMENQEKDLPVHEWRI